MKKRGEMPLSIILTYWKITIFRYRFENQHCSKNISQNNWVYENSAIYLLYENFIYSVLEENLRSNILWVDVTNAWLTTTLDSGLLTIYLHFEGCPTHFQSLGQLKALYHEIVCAVAHNNSFFLAENWIMNENAKSI